MCLAVPGRIVAVDDRADGPGGLVDFAGEVKHVSFEYLPDLRPGEYVIAHVGVAIQRLHPDDAEQTLRTFRDVGLL